MIQKITTKGKLFLGKCDGYNNGRRACPAYLTWELRQSKYGPEFSACGEVWNHIGTDLIMGGQCVDTVANMFPHNRKAQRMKKIWNLYHLNAMKAGTPEQTAAIIAWESQGNRYDYDAACEHLKSIGLYEVDPGDAQATGGMPEAVINKERGYRYAERWLYSPLPKAILGEIKSWEKGDIGK